MTIDRSLLERALDAPEAQARRFEALKEGARNQHDLLTSIVRRLREIDIIGDSPNANITGAIHGVIDGYVNWRAEAKALATRLRYVEAECQALRQGAGKLLAIRADDAADASVLAVERIERAMRGEGRT